MFRPLPLLVAMVLGVPATGLSQEIAASTIESTTHTRAEARSVFLLAEYWSCPEENLQALAQAADSIWGPLFDELVSEGAFLSWGPMTPIKAFDYDRQEGEITRHEIKPEWDWVGFWQAESEEAFTSAWAEFVSRLRAKFPDDPRPWRFCDDLTIVHYSMRAPG
jgi:hypothetical protein